MDGKEYKRWKIGNIGYNVGPQRLKWQQIGNTVGNNRQQPKVRAALAIALPLERGNADGEVDPIVWTKKRRN